MPNAQASLFSSSPTTAGAELRPVPAGSRPPAGTHAARVLELLSDGKPHTHHELYALHVIGHSRIADLRRRGYTIEAWRDGDDYCYQLVTGEAGDGE